MNCELCQRLERQCTYVLGPVRRKHRLRGNRQDSEVMNDNSASPARETQFVQPEMDMALGGAQLPLDPALKLKLDVSNTFWTPQPQGQQYLSLRETSDLPENWYNLGDPFGAAVEMEGLAGNASLTGPMLDESAATPQHAQSLSGVGKANDTLVSASQGAVVTSTSVSRSTSSPASIQHLPGSDWPSDFSLDAKKGYSNHLIGLSCESDPFLLRQYRYYSYDEHHMFRLDFRKISDGSTTQPLLFMMCDEATWQADIKAAEKMLSGQNGSESADAVVLAKIANRDLGSRLIRLCVNWPLSLFRFC